MSLIYGILRQWEELQKDIRRYVFTDRKFTLLFEYFFKKILGVFICLHFFSFTMEESKMKVEMYVICALQSCIAARLLEKVCSDSFCQYFWF